MLWLAVLPLAAFILTFVLLIKKNLFGLRLSFVWAAILWTGVAVVLTEGLSVFQLLTRGMVTAGWTFILVSIVIGWKLLPVNSPQPQTFKLKDFCIPDAVLIGITALIIVVAGINAFFAAPNNWDSMTYHLPRVLHWIQDQSVQYYPTHILRQLYQPPGAEFLILQFQILTGTDQFSNLVQWFALLGCAIVISLIVAELGAGRRGQVLSAFLAVTIPMAILQSSSTQNDLVAGFWMCTFVYFILRQKQFDFVGAGLALGFGLLTKGTIYIFAVPWLIWLLIAGLLKKRKNVFIEMLFIAAIAIVINAGFYSRNINLFGAPLSVGSEGYANTGNIFANGLSNVLRNIALHFGTPSTEFNARLKLGVLSAHSFLGLGKTASDEQNTWGEFDIPAWSTSEDVAGNPLHLILIAVGLIFVFVRRQKYTKLLFYAVCVVAVFLIFCTLLKWQLFHSRLQLPLFLLGVPLAALLLEQFRLKLLLPVFIVVIIALALPPLLSNERHPLVGKKNVFNVSRLEQYFFYRKFMALPYFVAVKEAVSRPGSQIGFLLGGDDWEYPLWILMKKARPDIRITHVGVNNVSARLAEKRDNNVSVIISALADPPNVLSLDKANYIKRRQITFMSVYENIRY